MELKEIIELFKKTIERKGWGDLSYIQIMDDGSGEIVSESFVGDEKEIVFEFNTEEELIKKLKE